MAPRHERQGDRRTGVRGGGMAGEHEDARADDRADAEGDEVDGGEAALERHAVVGGQRLHLRLGSFGLERRN